MKKIINVCRDKQHCKGVESDQKQVNELYPLEKMDKSAAYAAFTKTSCYILR